MLPQPGTPQDEYWREAAILYTALTRARDELILTYVDKPSLFLKVMAGYVDFHTLPDEDKLSKVLDIIRTEQVESAGLVIKNHDGNSI